MQYIWTPTGEGTEDEDPSEAILNQHFTPCGLNADWNVSAWHVGDNEPNRVSGDIYVVEDEDDFPKAARFFVVQRFYKDGDNDEINELAGPLTAEDAILTCEYYTMSDKRPCDTCDTCGDWIEIHDGQPVCKSGCEQPTGPDCYTPDTTKRTP